MATPSCPIAPQIFEAAVENMWTAGLGANRASAKSDMPDPFWLIVGFIAIACVLLFPLRLWMLSRHRHAEDEAGGDPVPLAPPERRNRG